MDILNKLVQKLIRNRKHPSLNLVMDEQHNKSISKLSINDKVDNKQLSMDEQSENNVTYFPEQVNGTISSKLSDLPDWFFIGAIIRWLYFNKEIALLDDILQSKEFSDILGRTFEFSDKQRIEEMIERSSEVGFTYCGCVALLEWKWEFDINEQTKLYYVLKEIGQPAHCEKIHERLYKHFPDDPLNLSLVCDILQTHSDIFISTELNTYGLRKWNIKNSIEKGSLHVIDEPANKVDEYDKILHSEYEVIDLPCKILSLLEKAEHPLRASEITKELGKNENVLIKRSDINRCLYGPDLREYIKQDSNYRWSINLISKSTAKPQNSEYLHNAQPERQNYQVGMKVRHVRLGEGIIAQVIDEYGRRQYKVEFKASPQILFAYKSASSDMKKQYKVELKGSAILLTVDETTLKPIADSEELKQDSITPVDQENDSSYIIPTITPDKHNDIPIIQHNTENQAILDNVLQFKNRETLENQNIVDQTYINQETQNDTGYLHNAQLERQNYRVGMKVRHPRLGEGIIVNVIDRYGKKQYKVEFKTRAILLTVDATTLMFMEFMADNEELGQSPVGPIEQEASKTSISTSDIMSCNDYENIFVELPKSEKQSASSVKDKADEYTHKITQNNKQTSKYKKIHEQPYSKSQELDEKTVIHKPISGFTYKKIALESFDFIPRHSALCLRLIDLIERVSISESDLLDKLSEIPLSYLELPDPVLEGLRSNNVFPDDGFDGLSCCTIGYLLKLCSEEAWMNFLLSGWQKLFNVYFPDNTCLDLIPLARNDCFSISDFSLPKDFGYLPLCVLGLQGQSLVFFRDLRILTLLDLEYYTEIELLKRGENIGHVLNSLLDLYSTIRYTRKENWAIIINFLNEPLSQFLMNLLNSIIISKRNLNIFIMREGLLNNKELTLEEIANQYGLTRERVRQIVERVSNKIKAALKSGRLDLSPIIRMITNMMYESGGTLNIDCFIERTHWNGDHNHLLKFLKFVFDANDIDLSLENNIISFRSQNNITHFLDKLEGYFKDVKELKTIEELQNTKIISKVIEELGLELSHATLVNYINMSENLGILPDGRIGLKEWRWAFPYTKKDKIQYVLKGQGNPMHYTELHAELQRLFPDDDFENVKATHAALGTHKDIFYLVNRGTFALREWNSEPYVSVGDAIEIVLKQSEIPLSFSDLFERVSEIGGYSYSNVRLALTRNSFIRVGVDLWDLIERSTLDKEWKAEEKLREDDVHPSMINLIKRLKNYGYKPLILNECIQLCRDVESNLDDLNEILDCISQCQYLKIHEYRDTYVGLSKWSWFASGYGSQSTTQQANLVEWYLRMTNRPANADGIANGILDKIGDYRLTAFDVASVCEKNPHRFGLDEDGNYILYLWEDAPKYKDAIEEMLKSSELDIEYIVSQLSNDSPDNNETIVATIHLYGDVFTEVSPFVWKLKEKFDHTKIDFTNLIPE